MARWKGTLIQVSRINQWLKNSLGMPYVTTQVESLVGPRRPGLTTQAIAWVEVQPLVYEFGLKGRVDTFFRAKRLAAQTRVNRGEPPETDDADFLAVTEVV